MPTAGHAWSSKEIISMEGALIYGFFQKAKRIFRDLEYDTFTHPRAYKGTLTITARKINSF